MQSQVAIISGVILEKIVAKRIFRTAIFCLLEFLDSMLKYLFQEVLMEMFHML